ncbi:hypothetical protein EYF80_027861 [Liparis tanakae]|uniref:Uncharacterized protein n=1 Tax=Liparis tanakae TaxID=230148 RepID=A0A4Z2HAM0_9TELE|nr:hypothetical protein EYF80_027861 [Liparis tanakae]
MKQGTDRYDRGRRKGGMVAVGRPNSSLNIGALPSSNLEVNPSHQGRGNVIISGHKKHRVNQSHRRKREHLRITLAI